MLSKFSVKKPLTILVATLAVVVLGVVAYLKMTPDLMPNMDFPYVILITSDPGASPEAIEQSVTRPLEQSMATLDQIKSVTSSSQDSVSMVVLEFEDGVNMDTVSIRHPAEDLRPAGELGRHSLLAVCAQDEPLHDPDVGCRHLARRGGRAGAERLRHG